MLKSPLVSPDWFVARCVESLNARKDLQQLEEEVTNHNEKMGLSNMPRFTDFELLLL